ncbi:MAG: very short patch repair endonuclease [Pyrinomonadaceae bacterium]
MVDVVDSETRHRMMSGIRHKDTKPELSIRQNLHRLGFRFRLHERRLPGKPDLVLKRYRAVIFVNGCFWHRHECDLFKWPSTRVEFWQDKLNRNHENDLKNLNLLDSQGWRVCIVWECAVKGPNSRIDCVIKNIETWLRSLETNVSFMEIAK